METGRQFSDEQRIWIRRMENPYASLAICEPDDDEPKVSQQLVKPSNNEPADGGNFDTPPQLTRRHD